jgi:hypothetical protein
MFLSVFIWQYILNFNTDYSFILKYLEHKTTHTFLWFDLIFFFTTNNYLITHNTHIARYFIHTYTYISCKRYYNMDIYTLIAVMFSWTISQPNICKRGI